jgi:hypothetical protein
MNELQHLEFLILTDLRSFHSQYSLFFSSYKMGAAGMVVHIIYVTRSEVFTAVNFKQTVFWDVAPCSPVLVTDILEESTASDFRTKE